MRRQLDDVPKRYRKYIKQLFSVKRFGDYSEGIFSDNSGLHTIRGVELIDTLPLNAASKKKVKEIYWLHDIPEIIIFDYTVIKKQNDKIFEQKLEYDERSAAQKLFDRKERSLLVQHNLAEKVLKGEDNNKVPKPEAVISAMIDRIEGNVYFHKNLAHWISSRKFAEKKLPQKQALAYTFLIQDLYSRNIANCKLSEEFKKAANYLLDYQIREVTNAWRDVPKDKIPKTINTYLQTYPPE